MRRSGKKPDWLPDWRRAEKYPKRLAPSGVWRWEFLRRNSQYQDDLEKLIGPHYDWADRSFGDDTYFSHFRKVFGIALPLPPADAGPSLWCQDAIRRIDGHYVKRDPYEFAFAIDLQRPLRAQFERARRHAEAIQGGYVRDRKIDVLKAKNHREKYPLYVRLLDAELSGASNREIDEVIFRHRPDGLRLVKDGLRVARYMRDRGFHDIQG